MTNLTLRDAKHRWAYLVKRGRWFQYFDIYMLDEIGRRYEELGTWPAVAHGFRTDAQSDKHRAIRIGNRTVEVSLRKAADALDQALREGVMHSQPNAPLSEIVRENLGLARSAFVLMFGPQLLWGGIALVFVGIVVATTADVASGLGMAVAGGVITRFAYRAEWR